jgi:Na+-transporting NADH:ubiquinone oxidoreductase subunit C
MMQETPRSALLVLLAVALVCSVLVSVSAVVLRPIQEANERIERYRHIVALTGLAAEDQVLDDAQVEAIIEKLDVRVVELESGRFVPLEPEQVDSRRAVSDPALSIAIPADADKARIGRRSRQELVYLVLAADDAADGGRLSRLILPVHGQGMWSTLYGLVALEADLNTIAAVTFYEQEETAGLGDQIESSAWQARWVGRRLFNRAGEFRFRIASGPVDDGSPAATHEVDGLSGATITGNAVTALMAFWFGPLGYEPLLEQLAAGEY